jgi:hypothetical protein
VIGGDEFGNRIRFGVEGLLDPCADDVLTDAPGFLGEAIETSSTVETRELSNGIEKRLVSRSLNERVGVSGRSREYRKALFDSRALKERPSVLGVCGDSSMKLCKSATSVGTIRRLPLGVIIYGLGLRLIGPSRISRRPGVVGEYTGLGDCVLRNSLTF